MAHGRWFCGSSAFVSEFLVKMEINITKHDLNSTKQRQNSLILYLGIQAKFNILKCNFYNILYLLKHNISDMSIFVYGGFIMAVRIARLLVDNLFDLLNLVNYSAS